MIFSKDPLVRTVGWVICLAPLAYLVAKETGVFDKVKETSEPYVDPTKDYLEDSLKQAKEFVENFKKSESHDKTK